MTPRTYYAIAENATREWLVITHHSAPILYTEPFTLADVPVFDACALVPVHLIPATEYAALTALRDAASDVVDDCYEYDLNPKEWLLVVAGRIDALKAALEAVDGATQTNQNGETK